MTTKNTCGLSDAGGIPVKILSIMLQMNKEKSLEHYANHSTCIDKLI